MRPGQDILYLSDADIEAAGVSPRALGDSVDFMLREKAAGRAVTRPKTGIFPDPNRFFLAMAGVMETPAYAAVKWGGTVADNDARGLPSISPMIILSDRITGLPLCILSGRWITSHRTAAITLVGGRYLAKKDSETIGFVACGVQARSHLLAFRAHFPLKRAFAYSRRRETAEAFAKEARAQGLETTVVTDPRRAVEDIDIVISSVPQGPTLKPFIDPAWFSPGSYAGLLDIGRAVDWSKPAAFDLMATDDHAQSAENVKLGRLGYLKPFDAELADLASGKKKARTDAKQRTGLIFSGLALGDVAVAGAIYEGALKSGKGTLLPL
jgi:ornithine cyclodeaminase/alanine dehydrogenase